MMKIVLALAFLGLASAVPMSRNDGLCSTKRNDVDPLCLLLMKELLGAQGTGAAGSEVDRLKELELLLVAGKRNDGVCNNKKRNDIDLSCLAMIEALIGPGTGTGATDNQVNRLKELELLLALGKRNDGLCNNKRDAMNLGCLLMIEELLGAKGTGTGSTGTDIDRLKELELLLAMQNN